MKDRTPQSVKNGTHRASTQCRQYTHLASTQCRHYTHKADNKCRHDTTQNRAENGTHRSSTLCRQFKTHKTVQEMEHTLQTGHHTTHCGKWNTQNIHTVQTVQHTRQCRKWNTQCRQYTAQGSHKAQSHSADNVPSTTADNFQSCINNDAMSTSEQNNKTEGAMKPQKIR